MPWEEPNAVQINIELQDVEPLIWRRIIVPHSTTLAQLHFVRDNYCNHAQGKLFGESMPLSGFAELLKAQNDGRPVFAHLIVPEMAQDESA